VKPSAKELSYRACPEPHLIPRLLILALPQMQIPAVSGHPWLLRVYDSYYKIELRYSIKIYIMIQSGTVTKARTKRLIRNTDNHPGKVKKIV